MFNDKVVAKYQKRSFHFSTDGEALSIDKMSNAEFEPRIDTYILRAVDNDSFNGEA